MFHQKVERYDTQPLSHNWVSDKQCIDVCFSFCVWVFLPIVDCCIELVMSTHWFYWQLMAVSPANSHLDMEIIWHVVHCLTTVCWLNLNFEPGTAWSLKPTPTNMSKDISDLNTTLSLEFHFKAMQTYANHYLHSISLLVLNVGNEGLIHNSYWW